MFNIDKKNFGETRVFQKSNNTIQQSVTLQQNTSLYYPICYCYVAKFSFNLEKKLDCRVF